MQALVIRLKSIMLLSWYIFFMQQVVHAAYIEQGSAFYWWSYLAPEVHVEILQRYVEVVLLNRTALSSIKPEVMKLRLVSREICCLFDRYIMTPKQLLKIIQDINSRPTQLPISPNKLLVLFFGIDNVQLNQKRAMSMREIERLRHKYRPITKNNTFYDQKIRSIKTYHEKNNHLGKLLIYLVHISSDQLDSPQLKPAIHKERLTYIKELIRDGAEVDSTANVMTGLSDFTGLIFSAWGNVDIMQMLVLSGAYVNIQDNLGRTALMIAISSDTAERVKYTMVYTLIVAGALLGISDNNDDTAYDYACKERNVPVAIRTLLASKQIESYLNNKIK